MSRFYLDAATGTQARRARGSRDVLEQLSMPGAMLTRNPDTGLAVISFKESKQFIVVNKRLIDYLLAQGKIRLSLEVFTLEGATLTSQPDDTAGV